MVFAKSAIATFPPDRRSPMMPEPTTAASRKAVPTVSATARLNNGWLIRNGGLLDCVNLYARRVVIDVIALQQVRQLFMELWLRCFARLRRTTTSRSHRQRSCVSHCRRAAPSLVVNLRIYVQIGLRIDDLHVREPGRQQTLAILFNQYRPTNAADVGEGIFTN